MKTEYKKTELGYVPEEWALMKINKIGIVITGSTPLTNNPQNYSEAGDGVLWATPGDLGKSKYVLNTSKTLSQKGFESTRKLPPKSILITCIGSTIGKIGMSASEMATNQQINSIVCNELNDPEFFYYITEYKAPYIKSLAGTQAVPLLNKTDFSNILVPVPPLPEQQKIAEILSTVDEKIAVIGEQISQTQELKRGLMQRLLTKGIGHTRFKDSPLGRIPESWEVVKLGDVSSKITDGSHFSPVPEKDTPFFIGTVKDMMEKNFNLDSCARISKKDYDALAKGGCKPEKNDILFSKDGTIGKTFVFDGLQDLVLLSSVAIIKPLLAEVSPDFISQALKSPVFYNQLEGLKSGSAIRRLVLKSIKEIKIPVPPKTEQIKLAKILSTVDEKIEVLQNIKQQYLQLKKGLMQQLLSGKVRVKTSEREMV